MTKSKTKLKLEIPQKTGAKPVGRPLKLTQEISDRLCEEISKSEVGLEHICKMEGMPHRITVIRWLTQSEKENAKEELKEFRNNYARAREAQADLMAERIIDIADDDKDDEKAFVGINHVQRDRLKIDSRKWIMSKILPKKYGDKIDVTTGGQAISPVITAMLDGKIIDGELK